MALDYAASSTAKGALLIFGHSNEGNKCSGFSLLTVDRNSSHNFSITHQTLSVKTSGRHNITVYAHDIECDGLLANGVSYPATISFIKDVETQNNNQGK